MDSKTYIDKTNKLFEQWKKDVETHRNNLPFITDGVVDPDQWFSQPVRPLFLLKEAYGQEGDADWDLIQDHLLTDGKIRSTWKRVSVWAKGILGTNKERIEPFTLTGKEIENFNNPYLHMIAAVNIKKFNGHKSSNDEDIMMHVQTYHEQLKQQLILCDPTVIICCHTAAFLEKILKEEYRNPYNENMYYYITLNGKKVLVIDFWHPANRFPQIMNYNCLMKIYQDALI